MPRATKPDPLTPGARLRAARQRAGLTQVVLAERMDVGQNVISDYERGRKAPSLDWLLRAARALGCKLAELAPEVS